MSRGSLVAIAVGVLLAVAGVLWTFTWKFEDFKTVFFGSVGIMLLLAGLLAVAIGYSEWQASKEFEQATADIATSTDTGSETAGEESDNNESKGENCES